ncbi:MAG: zinc ABC transporter substrate-binding protein [Oscillospiraceae bacterium]|nr:zinc ABC transporter substrate-binding protein [Oscillospiraceae bacterium]
MKKLAFLIMFSIFILLFSGCEANSEDCQIAATTLPVYTFTADLCAGTDLKVCQVITQNVSCLHDYTLQSSQMRIIETAKTIVISGAGLEDFLEDTLSHKHTIVDASANIELLCAEEEHNHTHGHKHDTDPHIWLSPQNAKIMASNICTGLTAQYPQYANTFSDNLTSLTAKLDALQVYGTQTLSQLSCRELITFHDGFSYFADAFDLTVLKAVEEEAGSEASAAELKEIITLVEDHALPAIFTETNGSESAARTICAETGAAYLSLDMAMSEGNYFEVMYRNIDTVKEALE